MKNASTTHLVLVSKNKSSENKITYESEVMWHIINKIFIISYRQRNK